jgi:hypothetical protein
LREIALHRLYGLGADQPDVERGVSRMSKAFKREIRILIHRVSGFCGIIAKQVDQYDESVALSHRYRRSPGQWLQPTGTSL